VVRRPLLAPILETALLNTLPHLGCGLARIVQYLRAGLSTALNAHNSLVAEHAPLQVALQPSPLAAALGIAVYSVLLFGAAVLVFQRQDLARS